VRSAAPAAWFLVPGIGAQGGQVEATLAAGLRDDGSGLIINASRAVMLAGDHRAAAEQLRREIEEARAQVQSSRRPSAPVAQPSTAGPERAALITALHALGAVKFGDFTLASGIKSPIYVDLRLLVSDPAVLGKAGEAYAQLLAGLPCDRIAGVPYAALPIATAVALATGKPMIYQRKEAKAYGLGKLIEGAFQPGERVVIIEDLITSGGSTLKTAEQLREAGLVVEHVLVLIDRQQGGVAALAEGGIAAHAVFTLTEIVDSLAERGLLSEEKRAEVRAVLGAGING
jgi:uridine monophosphate synthetase